MKRKLVRNLESLPGDPDREVETGVRRFVIGYRRVFASL